MSENCSGQPGGWTPTESATKKIGRFEDLIAWQKARSLTAAIYRITREPPLSSDINLVEQMQRSALSVMSNIAEGFERSTPTEFSRFLSIAKASCAEIRSQLYAAAVGHLSPERFKVVLSQAEESARVLGGLRAAVLRHQRSGRRRP